MHKTRHHSLIGVSQFFGSPIRHWTCATPHLYNQGMIFPALGNFNSCHATGTFARFGVASAHVIGSLLGKIRVVGDITVSDRYWRWRH
jgi:hypothetical protein